MDVCSQNKMEGKVTSSNLKISLQCFVILKFSACFSSKLIGSLLSFINLKRHGKLILKTKNGRYCKDLVDL